MVRKGLGVRGNSETDSSTWALVGRNTRGMNRSRGTCEHQSCKEHCVHSKPSWVYCVTVQRETQVGVTPQTG
ncbi:hypothetical protein TIFTF001_054895 [Ficus carica]|uniref:Uncharacterized protein n=1 Tax=Ficus carica TaxID=3494 RepID=A0AA88ELB7_FICCA|nr:hypothetical protein TIFTF001_054892 [Ficus carica]GMN73711.1 hypothetical protein TIFTF001_054893 [Ficus carica]GMN73717.1 hypothetical protein TIFTF001_054894 [Ficus carica]GMN73725.1 hypothetical protein TIFTF001_054895 [Ficus carica]